MCMMEVECKKCSVCRETKPLEDFEKRSKDTYSYRCKACASEYKRAVYQGKQTKIQLDRRVAKLEQFCEEHNINIEIKVVNDESEWR